MDYISQFWALTKNLCILYRVKGKSVTIKDLSPRMNNNLIMKHKEISIPEIR